MLEPPNLASDTLRAHLRDAYALAVEDIEFLPVGYDPHAWVYRVQMTNGDEYFLKVRDDRINVPALTIPHHLRAHGVKHLVAPLATLTGALWSTLADFFLVLYPFLRGETALRGGMSESQWRTYGSVVHQIHTAPLPRVLAQELRRETFTPGGYAELQALDRELAGTFDTPVESALAAFWRAHQSEIQTLIQRAGALGQSLRAAPPPFVLCHADLHTANVLVDAHGEIWIVDWDETVLAPRARDLMFAVGGISEAWVKPHQTTWFLQGYGEWETDLTALAYYRYAWAVQDIGSFGETVFRRDVGVATKQDALRALQSLFEPGEIVSIALSTPLPPI